MMAIPFSIPVFLFGFLLTGLSALAIWWIVRCFGQLGVAAVVVIAALALAVLSATRISHGSCSTT